MLAELRFDYKNKESGYRYQVELALLGELRLLVSHFCPKKQGPRPCLLMLLKLVVLAVVFYGNYLA